MQLILLAGFGAIFGSILRFLLLELGERYFGEAASWMVMIINLSASFLIGIAFALHLQSSMNVFWATGILGGYSTFSAPIVELADAFERNERGDRTLIEIKTLIAFFGGLVMLFLGIIVAKTF
ncbi:CrcB-like protein [Weissella oryzae SG25]|uniref:Fluoride-specific ion channel FluC n=1 Tax=Weissella oryzae (strain DSM 25784 / JCM 18191 / LMG 30913 / SG25) TaxID=1329250 RepID=A0A069CS29_WEIOS|nr:CrcB family protein [Weissella oryzae]GAK30610.1 CrcB-like protein [Weissella oryzae SG25]